MGNPFDSVAVKIALLGLVNDLPEPPSITEPSQFIEARELELARTISFKHETSITQQLAFICAYSDDPLHVMATCIEEVAGSRRGLVIRFAANTGRHEILLARLKEISVILQCEAANVNRCTNYELLLNAIVALNRKRIICRLRSRHAAFSKRSRGKPSLLRRLQFATDLLLRHPSIPNARSQALASEVHDLQRHFELLERMETAEALSRNSEKHLLALVRGISSLLTRYEQDLARVPYQPGLWSGNATEAMVDRLKKLSQYTTACDELLRAARRYQAFSHISVSFINLQQSSRRLSAEAASSMSEEILRKYAMNTLDQISKRCSRGNSSILGHARQLHQKDSKIHAEIQIMLFYEQHKGLLRPRVIASSKSACYLCALLFSIHGKYLNPSTHGKLYEGWKWPDGAKELDRLLPEFSNAIDQKLLQCLGTNSGRREDPFESRVDLLKAITPSILSKVSRSLHNLSRVTLRAVSDVGIPISGLSGEDLHSDINEGMSSSSSHSLISIRSIVKDADCHSTAVTVGDGGSKEDANAITSTASTSSRKISSRTTSLRTIRQQTSRSTIMSTLTTLPQSSCTPQTMQQSLTLSPANSSFERQTTQLAPLSPLPVDIDNVSSTDTVSHATTRSSIDGQDPVTDTNWRATSSTLLVQPEEIHTRSASLGPASALSVRSDALRSKSPEPIGRHQRQDSMGIESWIREQNPTEGSNQVNEDKGADEVAKEGDITLQQEEKGSEEARGETLCLREGEVVSYCFNGANEVVQLQLPRLHLYIHAAIGRRSYAANQHATALTPPMTPSPLQLEFHYLPFSFLSDSTDAPQVIDLSGPWVVKSMPEGVMFSEEGLLVRRGKTVLRIRATSG